MNPERSFTVVGGFSASDSLTFTWPLIRLMATPERISFEARFGLRRFFGPWTVDAGDVSLIRRWTGLGPGVEIHAGPSRMFVFRIVGSADAVLTSLAALGYRPSS